MNKMKDGKLSLQKKNRLLPWRKLIYEEMISRRPHTPMAVIEGNRFTIRRAGEVMCWRIPWTLPNGNRLIIKMEHLSDYNPSGSMYDRLYPYLFRQWEERGFILPGKEGTPVIECSAGNAGAAFCHAAEKLGFLNHTLLIPADIYPARIEQVSSYGGNVVLSPSGEGELGYVRLIENILQQDAKGKGRIGRDRSRMFPVTNTIRVPNEPYARLVQEVYDDLQDVKYPQRIDSFLFGIGAGNTISQVSIAIRAMQRSPLTVHVAEFAECPFIAAIREGKSPPKNGGWPAGDMGGTIYGVPIEKLNLRLEVIDKILPLGPKEREEGRAMANQALGLCAGRPTGMTIIGALKVASRIRSSQILIIVFDSIAKYEEHYDAVMDVDFQNGVPIRCSDRNVRRRARQEIAVEQAFLTRPPGNLQLASLQTSAPR